MFCRSRHIYQEGLVNWDPNNQLSPATYLCLSQAARTCISIVTCRFRFVFSELRLEWIAHFVDISAIVDHPCFKISFHNSHILNKG